MSRGVRGILPLAMVCGLASCARVLGATRVGSAAPDGTTFHQIAVGRDARTFLMHRAPHLATLAPVFFILHGTSATANVVMDESGMNRVADSLGAIVVYPNGTGGIPYVRLFWNVAGCCSDASRPNEAAMIRTIVDTIGAHYAIDRTRIGVAGFSDAGTLAYLLACHDADVITAIGVISGEVPERACVPQPPVSALVFHGTADRNVRYGATRAHVARWAAGESCGLAAADTSVALIHDRYAGCAGGAVVELYTIRGGKHAWPGGRGSSIFAPHPSRAIDASRAFAAFTLAHPRPAEH
ncbi:MAG TPA: PHB depolymerase family esterase [Gemmatimonadaceae bacterium]|nr:PHB depolymerase family esterase [Gemmatimonadaceae bacterium]